MSAKTLGTVALSVLLTCAACQTATLPPDLHSFEPGENQIAHRADDIPYGPGPDTVPFKTEMAVLEGDPNAPGLFTIRIRTTEAWLMPPHSHPRAERVTVISGSLSVGFGRYVDESKGQRFSAGDYYVNAPGAVHYVWTDVPVEIQITGMGPWEVDPVE